MAKFCTRCGRPLEEGKSCDCRNASPWKKLMDVVHMFVDGFAEKMGIDLSGRHALDPFERHRTVVPECLTPNDDERLVKEYKDVAILRSRILFKRSEGRLCVTNKRIIFRASGISLTGPIVLQHEFALPEIAGVEIKKSQRFSLLSFFAVLAFASFIQGAVDSFLSSFVSSSRALVATLAYLLVLAAGVSFFLLKKKLWIKLALLSAGMGALNSLSATPSFTQLLDADNLRAAIITLPNALCAVLDVLMVVLLILICMVPDLKLCIKNSSGADSIQICRKRWGFGLKPTEENTGFSEVLPGNNIDVLATELGAIINDLQTMGDLAIEKWQVPQQEKEN